MTNAPAPPKLLVDKLGASFSTISVPAEMVVAPAYVLAAVKITVPVLEVGLLIVKAPLAPLKMPRKIIVLPFGALMVEAPLMVIGLSMVRPVVLASNVVEADMVTAPVALPKAALLPKPIVPAVSTVPPL